MFSREQPSTTALAEYTPGEFDHIAADAALPEEISGVNRQLLRTTTPKSHYDVSDVYTNGIIVRRFDADENARLLGRAEPIFEVERIPFVYPLALEVFQITSDHWALHFAYDGDPGNIELVRLSGGSFEYLDKDSQWQQGNLSPQSENPILEYAIAQLEGFYVEGGMT